MRFFKELLKQAMVIYTQLGVYFYIYTGTKMEIPHCELEQYHYNALKDWRYGLEGMMDCLREETSYYLPYTKDVQPDTKSAQPEPIIEPRIIHLRIDKRALELDRRVTELENCNRYLLRKIKELTTKASNRGPKYLLDIN